MDAPTAEEVQEACHPLVSLLSKSEKAQQKLAPGTWQHTMLGDNVKTLRVAVALMGKDPPGTGSFTRSDLQDTLSTLASIVAKVGKTQSKFLPRTSQHTLQQNRLRALQVAELLVSAELEGRDAEPGAAADPAS